MKRMVVLFLVFALSIASPMQSNLSKAVEEPDKMLKLLNSNESALSSLVDSVLAEYFAYRDSGFDKSDNRSFNIILREEVAVDSTNRLRALKVIENCIGATFVNVETDYSITSIETDQTSDCLATILATERIEIDYQYPNSLAIDNMGYEVEHTILLDYDFATRKGIVVSDAYYEMIADFYSSSYTATEDIEDYTPVSSPDLILTNPASSYDRLVGVNYAETWWNGHNPAYYTATSDCANFVSQCLKAGYVPFISGNYSTGWYADTGGGTAAWEIVSSADTFWQNQSVTRYSVTANSSSTYSKCGLGNPIYWLNAPGSSATGHLMIITGFNSAGVPYYCAHNSNQHDVPISSLSSTHNSLYTLEFAHDYIYVNYGNATYHKKKCTICNSTKLEPHTWMLAKKTAGSDGIRTTYQCSLCGATKTSKSDIIPASEINDPLRGNCCD